MDPDYLPGQCGGDSPGHRERSLTPFLRSQGQADGRGLVFNSRISPSPSRSLHRRHRRHRLSTLSDTEQDIGASTSTMPRRNLAKELELEENDETDRVERREERGLAREERTSAKRVSMTVRGGERVRRVEEERVRKTVRLRTRPRETSDYSSQSQSDSEPNMVTSTPKTNTRNPLLLQGSPRLRAFDGTDWIWSPRTSYTYTQSLTYRDRVTPGREVPMPHMTRLPLYSHQAGLEHTELWELSEIELRRGRLERLEEYSGDELGSSPHLIYRRRLVKRTLGSRLSSLLGYLLLPLTFLMSFLTTVTEKLRSLQSKTMEFLSHLPSYLTTSLASQPVGLNLAEDDLMTDDEDESGLEQFLTNQKIHYSNIKEDALETYNANTIKESSYTSTFFSTIRSLLFLDSVRSTFYKLIRRNESPRRGKTRAPKRVIFTGVPEMPQTGAIDPYVSDERELNVQVIQDDQELQLNLSSSPKQTQESSRTSSASRVNKMFISILLYPFILLQSLASASAAEIASFYEGEEGDIEAEEERGEEEQPGDVTERESEPSGRQKAKARARKGKRQTLRQWLWSLFYQKKAIRRSRRLQGLDPEQEALREKKRERRVQSKDTGETATDVDISEAEDEEEEELIVLSYLQNLKVWCSRMFVREMSDRVEDGGEKEDVSLINGSAAKSKSRGGGLLASLTSYLTSILYKKQIRRSRRLKGLEPENSGFQSSRRSRRLKSDDISQEGQVSDLGTESEDFINEEYYQLFVTVWLQSIFDLLKSKLLGKPEDSKREEETNTSKPPLTARAVKPVVSLFSKLKQVFLSLLFTKHERRSRRLRGLAPESGELQERRRTRTRKTRAVESDINSVSSEEDIEDIYEFRMVGWIKMVTSSLAQLWRGGRDSSLSVDNLTRHNKQLETERERTSSEKSERNVRSWLRAQESPVTTVTREEEEQKELEIATRKKALNIFSFMFLDFLPSWSTSWFWQYRGARKSRRLRGLDPVEEEAWNTWRRKTVNSEDPVNTQPEESRSRFLLCFLLLLLLLGLLFFSCRTYPESCENTSDFVKNSTINAINVLKENGLSLTNYGIEVVSAMANLFSSTGAIMLEGSVSGLKSIFSGGYSVAEKTGGGLYEVCWYLWQGVTGSIYQLSSLCYHTLSSLASAGHLLTHNAMESFSDLCYAGYRGFTGGLYGLLSRLYDGLSFISSSFCLLIKMTVQQFYDLASFCYQSFSEGLHQLSLTGYQGVSSLYSGGYLMIERTVGLVSSHLSQLPHYLDLTPALTSTSHLMSGLWSSVTRPLSASVSLLLYGTKTAGDMILIGVTSATSVLNTGLASAAEVSLALLKTPAVFLMDLPSTSLNGLVWLLSSISSTVSDLLSALSLSMTDLKSSVLTSNVTSALLMFPYNSVRALGSFLASQVWPEPQPPVTVNYDLLVERILDSHKFVTAISNMANSKVEVETEKFRGQIYELIQSQALKGQQVNLTPEDIRLKMESIKVEVSEEIKRMTEEFVRSNFETREKISVDQNANIEGLKEKYNTLLSEADTLKQEVTSQSGNFEKVNTELKQEIETLRSQITILELEQKNLNQTISGCCRNHTSIELTVEKYVKELLEAVMQNSSTTATTNTFAAWVNSFVLARSELESKLEEVTSSIDQKIQVEVGEEVKRVVRVETEQSKQQIMERVSERIKLEFQQRINKTEAKEGLSREEVVKIVKDALIQYDADKTGMFDYALETAGGSVISTRCTQTYVQKTAMYSIFGIPIWYPSNNPRTVIQPGVQPGECWAFKGSTGFIVIKLSDWVVPTRFSMEHISRSMSPSGKIDSAPREFEVLGLSSEKETNPVKLGEFTYSEDLEPLQYFEVQFPTKQAFSYIELDIKSNHGNLNYTCLYRFRVHGVAPSP